MVSVVSQLTTAFASVVVQKIDVNVALQMNLHIDLTQFLLLISRYLPYQHHRHYRC